MQHYISQLNEAQQEPVFQKDGPMIIIAGAGFRENARVDGSYFVFDEFGRRCF